MERRYLLMTGRLPDHEEEARKVSDDVIGKPFSIYEMDDLIKSWELPQGSRIMVVDDEEPIRDMIKDVVEDSGYTPVVCKSGEEALKKFEETESNGIAAVISDINMLGITGIELVKTIKKIPE